MFEKKRQEEKTRKEKEEKQRKAEESRKKSRENAKKEKQRKQGESRPFQPSGSQPQATTFLEEVRREVLRCLKEVLPLASGGPAPAQVLAGSPAYDLAWPRLQMR